MQGEVDVYDCIIVFYLLHLKIYKTGGSMSYQEFISEVLKRLKTNLPLGTEIKVQKIIKNNNLHLDGLTIMSEKSNVSPTFYLNYYYEDYKEHEDMDLITELILSSYREQPSIGHINVDFFTDFLEVKDKIAYKLVNFNLNKELLKDVPHIPYLDLAIVFYCIVQRPGFPNGTILIHNQHLKLWNLTDRELYQIAIENTPQLLPCHLINIRELLSDTYLASHYCSEQGDLSIDDLDKFDAENESDALMPTMYVLSNQSKIFGASVILYMNLLEEISERFQSSFYILPSSIHEVILVPDIDQSKLDHYSEMVMEVNSKHVLDEEILSDHAYYYNRDQKALTYY